MNILQTLYNNTFMQIKLRHWFNCEDRFISSCDVKNRKNTKISYTYSVTLYTFDYMHKIKT